MAVDTLKHYEEVRAALFDEWDPIGINIDPNAPKNEYDPYAAGLVKLLSDGASEAEIFSLLWKIETEMIGLEGNRSSTRAFATALMSRRAGWSHGL